MTAALVALLALLAIVSGAEEERVATNEPKFISTGGHRSVREGEDVELLCDVDDLGEYVILWKFNRSQVLFAGNLRIHRDARLSRDDLKGSLVIRSFRAENSGEYTCQLSTNPPQDITYHVHLLGPPVIHAQPQSQSIVVKRRERVALTCQTDGARVQWKREGSQHVLATGPQLVLKEAGPEDAGVYKCEASNEIGQSSHRFHVQVLYAPSMASERSVIHAPIGTLVRLECHVQSEPPASVEWFRSRNQRVLPSQHVRIERVSAERTALVLESVTRQDYDNYTCLANNSLGHASQVFDVTGRPGTPTFTTQPLIGRSDSTRLEWAVDSESPVTRFVLRVRRPEKEWQVFEVIPEDQQPATDSVRKVAGHVLAGLELDQEYEADVLAVNPFGQTRSHVFAFVTSSASRAALSLFALVVTCLLARATCK